MLRGCGQKLILLGLCAGLGLLTGGLAGQASETAENEHAAQAGEATKNDRGAEAKAAEPVRLDPPLNGHFDINVLRKGEKVQQFRTPIKPIIEFIGIHNNWQAEVGVTIEFGSASGAAELIQLGSRAEDDVRRALQGFEPQGLLAPEGKYRFKRTLTNLLNVRLRTAQVRQVYVTEFKLGYLGGR
jgi:hypothetical protein